MKCSCKSGTRIKEVVCKKCKGGVYFNLRNEMIGSCPKCNGTGVYKMTVPCRSCEQHKVKNPVIRPELARLLKGGLCQPN